MPIFIIYDSEKVWKKAYTKFEDALEAVDIVIDEVNACAKKDGYYEVEEDRPAKMEEEISQKEAEKDSMGGVMVAWNEYEKIGVFIMELTY
jgi:chorismate synthase